MANEITCEYHADRVSNSCSYLHVGVKVSVMVLIYGTSDGWPRRPQNKHTLNIVSYQLLRRIVSIQRAALQIQNARTLPVTGSRMAGSIPKKGTVAEPGLVSMAPGKGVTTIEPVSVCLHE